jgi:hypothetical protein
VVPATRAREGFVVHCPRCKGFVEDGSSVCPTCNAQLHGQYRGVGITGPQSRPPPIYAAQRPYVQRAPAPPARPPPAYPPPVPVGPTYEPMKARSVLAIALTVLVAVVLTMVIVAFLWLAPFEDDTHPSHITVNIASPSVMQRQVDGQAHWDAVLNINKITPRDENVRWTQVGVVVRSAEGSVLDTTSPLHQDRGVYDDYSGGTVYVEFWFIETSGDDRLSAGDAIKITGMTEAYEGATIELVRGGDRIGSIVLPTEFY